MIQRLYRNYLAVLDSYAMRNPYTWVYGLGRSTIALGGLITFTFSSIHTLFDPILFAKLSFNSSFDKINLFYLLGFKNLLYGQILSIVILLTVISGYFPRVTGVLHWWVTFSFQQAASIVEGGDQVASIVTLLLIPVTLLDSRTNQWSKPLHNLSIYNKFIGNIFLSLIALQMSVVYFHAAVEKMYRSLEWRNGTALYYFSKDVSFGSPPWLAYFYDKILQIPIIVSSLTWGVMLFELLLAGALLMSANYRRHLLAFGIFFHLFIAIQFGLVSFFFSMTGGLIIYLLPRDAPSWLGARGQRNQALTTVRVSNL